MEPPFQSALSTLVAFLALTWPGLLAVSTYRLIVPGPRVDWGTSAAQGLFFSVINYIVLFPALYFVSNVERATTAPRLYWLSSLVLLALGPIGLAVVWVWVRRRPAVSRWLQHPDPSPWDHYFNRRENKFVILRLLDGNIIGGYFGPGSYASSFPDHGDLYLSALYQVDENGKFGDPISGTDGLLIRGNQYKYIELFEVPEQG